MPGLSLVIARKEVTDGLRDHRALVSAALYALMGPAVVFMVSLAPQVKGGGGSTALVGMISVFTLVSAFVGGMSIAMDALAGERERRSLLPLLLNPVSRRAVIFGKWLAIGFFSTAGLLLNLAGFALVAAVSGIRMGGAPGFLLIMACGLVPLALFAGALELAISTVCRGVKEAHTYLSLVVFLPMGLGMFVVFFPRAVRDWWHVLPVAGQQWQLEAWMLGGQAGWLEPLGLGVVTAIAAAGMLWAAARRLESDDVVYGN